MAKQQLILSFNKTSGIYSGFIYHGQGNLRQEDLNTEYFMYKTVEMDPDTETWEGDINTGRIVALAEQPQEIRESEVDAATQERIFQKYKYYKQLNIIFGIMDQLIDINNPETTSTYADLDTTEYEAFKAYLTQMRLDLEAEKQGYIDDPAFRYISKEEEHQIFMDSVAGDGLRAEIQPEHPFEIIK